MAYTKPLPEFDSYNRPYWEAAKRHELVMQYCKDCGHYQFPPSSLCQQCLGENIGFKKVSGRGKIWSFNVFHQRYWTSFGEDIPYNTIWVQLDEGPFMISNLVGVKNEDIKVDMAVEVIFDDITEEWTLPKFKVASLIQLS